MKLYEIRAYIGEKRTYYNQIFTTMEAACDKAKRLEETEGVKFSFGSAIYELFQIGDTFRYDCMRSQKVYLS